MKLARLANCILVWRSSNDDLADKIGKMAKKIGGKIPVLGLISKLTTPEGGFEDELTYTEVRGLRQFHTPTSRIVLLSPPSRSCLYEFHLGQHAFSALYILPPPVLTQNELGNFFTFSSRFPMQYARYVFDLAPEGFGVACFDLEALRGKQGSRRVVLFCAWMGRYMTGLAPRQAILAAARRVGVTGDLEVEVERIMLFAEETKKKYKYMGARESVSLSGTKKSIFSLLCIDMTVSLHAVSSHCKGAHAQPSPDALELLAQTLSEASEPVSAHTPEMHVPWAVGRSRPSQFLLSQTNLG